MMSDAPKAQNGDWGAVTLLFLLVAIFVVGLMLMV